MDLDTETHARLRRVYGDNPTAEQVQQFAASTRYLCEMYWQHRTDKLWFGDFAWLRALTNTCGELADEEKLPNTFTPRYGNDSVQFRSKSHSDIARCIECTLVDLLSPSQPAKISWWQKLTEKNKA